MAPLQGVTRNPNDWTLQNQLTLVYSPLLSSGQETNWVSECVEFNVHSTRDGHFGDESFQLNTWLWYWKKQIYNTQDKHKKAPKAKPNKKKLTLV